MKINLSANLQEWVDAGVESVEQAFANVGRMTAHKDLAHRVKREEAHNVLNGTLQEPSFAEEARRAGQTVTELATIILAKPDEFMDREKARRSLIQRVRGAKTPLEVEALLGKNGIPFHRVKGGGDVR